MRQRKRLRLDGYNYSRSGAYFVTVCLRERRPLFGSVRSDSGEPIVELSAAGRVVREAWLGLTERLSQVDLDESIVMPDHVHGIVVLHEPSVDGAGDLTVAPTVHESGVCADGAGDPRVAPTGGGFVGSSRVAPTLGRVVGAFKSIAAREVNRQMQLSGPLWQRGYYDRVIRDDRELETLREYIIQNPLRSSMKSAPL